MKLHYCFLVCTFNRAKDLGELLSSALAQREEPGVVLEILVVDNNSTDRTREVVEQFRARDPRVRYLFEARQGKSFALNSGLAATEAGVYSVIDDDVVLPPDFLTNLHRAFSEFPEAHFVGGKVLPVFESPPPAWLTKERWAPIAIADYGETPFAVNANRPVCLLTGRFRTGTVRRVGGYPLDLSVAPGLIGGTEDADLYERLWAAGYGGQYDPRLSLHHKVPPDQITRRHFRRWHRGHGRFLSRQSEGQAPRGTPILGIPGYLLRDAARDTLALCTDWIRGSNQDRRIDAADRLSFFLGFAGEALRARVSQARRTLHLTPPSTNTP